MTLQAVRGAGRMRAGDALPARLYAEDMMRIFNLKKSRFYELAKRGRFERFEQRPAIGRPSWSGALVQKYLDGEGSSSRFVVKAGSR